ncbi:MAG: YidC/Oxa1 family membrane protein insertase [Gaiellaceae bacterium]
MMLALLEPIERPLAAMLEFLHESIGLPWAWAIVATTVIVRIVLVPLTVRQIHSMQNLQAHAPEMKAIQQRYKGDRARQNEELMKFYKENKINPAASCLPIVAQIPVFIALFFVLRDFKDEILPRFPEADLSWLQVVPDITAEANAHWSGYLLLAIYAISQTTSTLLMSTTMDKTQRTLLLVLPLAFLFFILNFPAGLVLYWVTTNLWTTGQGLITRRMMPKPEPPPKRTSRTPPRSDESEDGAKGAPSGPKPAPTAVGTPRKVKRKKKARR